MTNKPRSPIFVPSKGRYKTPYTIRALQGLGVDFSIVVEKQEEREYRKIAKGANVIVLPHQDKGLTVTRNWIWDHAQSIGAEYFWTFDDNIENFWRLHKNMKHKIRTPAFLRAIEDFAYRYKNLYITGMEYEMFVPRKIKIPPFRLNTRVYSNMLIKTDIPYRNELFYNDDTDLCIRVMKDGHPTCLFIAFLANKKTTMVVKGGMTEYYKKTNHRREFAEELRRAHPDIVKIVWKYGRWHHKVDYSEFKRNILIRKESAEESQGVNNYGMKLRKL